MRLINSATVRLEEFSPSRIPAYAILSHRWEEDEIGFQEMESRTWATRSKKGFLKIQRACKQALSDGHSYIWIDTCCIDKRSSAELSEAINSMFRWYKNTCICYTYMSDVSDPTSHMEFRKSVWFTRGWTLQELIAPSKIAFFSKNWTIIGSKDSLRKLLVDVTGIDSFILLTGRTHVYSIAQRMSWASGRITERVEDMAYCLMGLFDVNMPLLYGEGEKAFVRLQEEIIKKTNDQSIFAWRGPRTDIVAKRLFATTPYMFVNCGNIKKAPRPFAQKPFQLTNRGLEVKIELIAWAVNTYVGILACQDIEKRSWIGVFLQPAREEGIYVRVRFENEMIAWITDDEIQSYQNTPDSRLSERSIYIQDSHQFLGDDHPVFNGFQMAKVPSELPVSDVRCVTREHVGGSPAVYSDSRFRHGDSMVRMLPGTIGTTAVIEYSFYADETIGASVILQLGFSEKCEPCVLIIELHNTPTSKVTNILELFENSQCFMGDANWERVATLVSSCSHRKWRGSHGSGLDGVVIKWLGKPYEAWTYDVLNGRLRLTASPEWKAEQAIWVIELSSTSDHAGSDDWTNIYSGVIPLGVSGALPAFRSPYIHS